MTIYERIEALCAEAGEDASDVCLSAGISEDVLTEMKVGKEYNLTDDVLREVADTLNTSIDYLYGWTDDSLNYADPDLLNYVPIAILDEWNKEGLTDEEMGHRAIERDKAQYEDYMNEQKPREC